MLFQCKTYTFFLLKTLIRMTKKDYIIETKIKLGQVGWKDYTNVGSA